MKDSSNNTVQKKHAASLNKPSMSAISKPRTSLTLTVSKTDKQSKKPSSNVSIPVSNDKKSTVSSSLALGNLVEESHFTLKDNFFVILKEEIITKIL